MKNKTIIGALMLLMGVILIGAGVHAQQVDAPAAALAPAEVKAAADVPAPVIALDEKPAPAAAPAVATTTDQKPAEKPADTKPADAVAVVVVPEAVTPVVMDVAASNAAAILLPPSDDKPIPGAKAVTNAENLISITLDDVEMADVVKMFTRISGANIIASPSNLVGKVSVNLTDVEWRPALESILDMNNLSLLEKTPGSSVYSVVPKQIGAPEPLLVETFFLKYASVTSVLTVVQSMVGVGGKVSPFPSRNAIVVRTTSANLGEIKGIIERIDKLRDQVFIEAKFMELSDQAIKDLGINWQVLQGYSVSAGNLNWSQTQNRNWDQTRTDASSQWDKRGNVDQMNHRYDINGVQYEESATTYEEAPPSSGNWVSRTTVTPTRTVTDTIDKGKNLTSDITDGFTKSIADVRTAVFGAKDFQLILSMLKQMNGVSIVSNPKIIVANEEVATIHIGQTERPFISSVTPGQQGIAPVVTYNPGEPVELGVKLTVTPTVNTESNITVRIMPELTRFMRDAVAPNGQTYPVVGTKKINTIFCLESGKTVAIGGLTESDDREVTTKVPLLGDIPLIGKYLFTHTHKEKQQQETIIFVTVGLALPDHMEAEVGLPEDTQLTRTKMLETKAKREEFRANLEKAKQVQEADTEKKVQKARSRLRK